MSTIMSQSANLPSQPSGNLDVCHSAASQLPCQHYSVETDANRLRNNTSILYHPTDELENLDSEVGISTENIIQDEDVSVESQQAQSVSIPHQESSESFVVVPQQESSGGFEMISKPSQLHVDADVPQTQTDTDDQCVTDVTLCNPPYLRNQSSQLTSCPTETMDHSGSSSYCQVEPEDEGISVMSNAQLSTTDDHRRHVVDGGGSFSDASSNDSSIVVLDEAAEGNVTIQGVDATRHINIPGMTDGIQINIKNAARSVQVGTNNVMHVHKGAAGVHSNQDNSSQNNPRQKKKFDIKVPKRRISGQDIDTIAIHLGKDWRRLGMKIGFVSGELDTFQHDHALDGLREIILQMMLAWRERKGTEALLRVIVQELLAIKRPDVAMLFHDEGV